MSHYHLGNETEAEENFLKALEQIQDQNQTIENPQQHKAGEMDLSKNYRWQNTSGQPDYGSFVGLGKSDLKILIGPDQLAKIPVDSLRKDSLTLAKNYRDSNLRAKKRRAMSLYGNLSLLYYQKNDLASAAECNEKVINLSEYFILKSLFTVMDEKNYGNSTLLNTECHLKLGNYTKAEQNFIKWLKCNVRMSKIFDSNNLDSNNPYDPYVKNIWEDIWENNSRFSNIIEMEPQFLKKFADYTDIQNLKPKISAQIFRSVGDYYDEISPSKNACHYFKKALTKLQQVQDNDRQAEAEINFRIGNLIEESEATEYLEQALSIYQDLEGNESINVAACYKSMGRYEKALDIYTKIHGPIHSDIGNTYREMAIEEYFKENLPKSLEYAKSS